MLSEQAGTSFDEKAYIMALAVIEAKVKLLAPADRDDLFELIREFMTATDEEAREAAAIAISEVMESTTATVGKVAWKENATPGPWVSYVGKRIRELRTAAGLTQDQLAERSGLTQSHLCRLERGEHSPNGLTLEKIAKGLGIPTSQLDPSEREID